LKRGKSQRVSFLGRFHVKQRPLDPEQPHHIAMRDALAVGGAEFFPPPLSRGRMHKLSRSRGAIAPELCQTAMSKILPSARSPDGAEQNPGTIYEL
jgi:hypothetical protein